MEISKLCSHRSAMAPPVLIAVSVIIVFTCLAYKFYSRVRFKLPPGPRTSPVVGNFYDIKPVKFKCFAEMAEVYGPIFSVYLGSQRNIVVTTAELAKEVLKEKDQYLADRHRSRSAARMSRNGKDLIWADYGPHYVKVRKLCNLELFTPKRLEGLRPIREDEVTAMVESILKFSINPGNKGKSLLVRNFLESVAFNNITRLVFGKRFVNSKGELDEQGQEFKAIVSNGIKIGARHSVEECVPWLQWIFTCEINQVLDKHNARRDRLTRLIMDEHTLARQKSGNTEQHFVDALLTLQKDYDLSDDTVIGLLWDMIIAGMDTTTVSVEWAMAELVKNPRVQRKAQEELDRVIGSERIMTEADFSKLPYLKSVAKEALRLHPPTPLMLPHKATANVKIGGYDIPKGSVVHVNVWAIARDPTSWKNPLEFRPERFLEEEDVDIKGRDYRLLPFGAGRRICPGAQLALNLATSMLGHLLHHFTWSPPPGMRPEDIDFEGSPGIASYMKTPLQAVATPRLPTDHLYNRVPAAVV